MILYNAGEVYTFENWFYISDLAHASMLLLSNNVLLAFINTVHKYYDACVF